jgi:hypothetical protein
MANDNKNQLIEAIAKLIKLTQEGRIMWQAADKTGLPSDTDISRSDSVYTAVYRNQRLRIYRSLTRMRRDDTAAWLRSMSKPELGSSYTWIHSVVLQFVDDDGRTKWTFPRNDALSDLLTAVQYQSAGVGEFINSLLAEE